MQVYGCHFLIITKANGIAGARKIGWLATIALFVSADEILLRSSKGYKNYDALDTADLGRHGETTIWGSTRTLAQSLDRALRSIH